MELQSYKMILFLLTFSLIIGMLHIQNVWYTSLKKTNANVSAHNFVNFCAAVSYEKTSAEQYQMFQQRVSNQAFDEMVHRGQWPKSNTMTFNYSISWVVSDSHVKGEIKERTANGNLSSGGSYFYIYQQHSDGKHLKFKSLCHFSDLFNGHYIVCCPLVKNCSQITVERRFKEYHGLMSRGSVLQLFAIEDKLIIMNKIVCFANSRALPWKMVVWKLAKDRSKTMCTEAYSSHGVSMNYDFSSLCQCLKRYKNIVLIGASHLRMINEYLNQVCQSLPTRNVIAQKIHESIPLLYNLTDMYRNTSVPTQFILQFGSHDLYYMQTNFVFNQSLKLYETFLEKLNMIAKLNKNIHVMILSPPPSPYKHGVSNLLRAAFSYQLERLAKLNNLKYYNFFLPLYTCVNDYPRVQGQSNHYFMGGKGIGKQIWYDVFKNICQNDL